MPHLFIVTLTINELTLVFSLAQFFPWFSFSPTLWALMYVAGFCTSCL